MLKHIKPFGLCANSAMAPFGPIDVESIDYVQEIFERSLNSSSSCGWYCSPKQFKTFNDDPLSILLSKHNYRYLVYGPEKTGLIEKIVNTLEGLNANVWIVSDGIRRESIEQLKGHTNRTTFTGVSSAYDKWRAGLQTKV